MEKDGQHKLCVVCCCSYSVAGGGDTEFEAGGWRGNGSFDQFLVELEQSLVEESSDPSGVKKSKGVAVVERNFKKSSLLNSLRRFGDKVDVCWECLKYIKETMEMGTMTKEVEKEVTRLQKELMAELRKLQGCFAEYYGAMKKVEDNVQNSDVSCLESLISRQGGGRKGIGKELIIFREKIIEVAADMSRFQTELDNTFNFSVAHLATSTTGAFTTRTRKRKGSFTIEQTINGGFNDYDCPIDPSPYLYHDDFDDNADFDGNSGNLSEDDKQYDCDKDADFVVKSENFSEDDNKSDDSCGDIDFELSDMPREKKMPKKKKNGSTPVFTLNNLSKLKRSIVQAIINRQRLFSRRVSQLNVENPLDLPIYHRYPFEYDNTTRIMTACGVTVTLQDKQLCCSICDFKADPIDNNRRVQKSIDSIYNHVARTHSDALQCHICLKQCSSVNKFNAHRLTHKNPSSCICKVCEKPFAFAESLEGHLWTHLNEEEKAEAVKNGKVPYTVRKKMENQALEKNHEDNSSSLSNNFICTTCGKGYSSQFNLQRHEKSTHNDRIVVCPKCGKSMKERSYRVYHQRYACRVGAFELNAKRHVCLKCNKTYQSEKSLRKHFERTHSSDAIERPYICDVCGKGYKTGGDMRYHAKTHSEVRPWKCDNCGKDYNMKRNLTRHLVSCLAKSKKRSCS